MSTDAMSEVTQVSYQTPSEFAEDDDEFDAPPPFSQSEPPPRATQSMPISAYRGSTKNREELLARWRREADPSSALSTRISRGIAVITELRALNAAALEDLAEAKKDNEVIKGLESTVETAETMLQSAKSDIESLEEEVIELRKAREVAEDAKAAAEQTREEAIIEIARWRRVAEAANASNGRLTPEPVIAAAAAGAVVAFFARSMMK